MHADEGVLADKLGSFLATGKYAYDPQEHHGPALAYATRLSARLAGHRTYQSLTEQTLRVVPAIAGILLALSPWLLARVMGRTSAHWAAGFLAVSPAMIYYSRYFIPEMLLALWTALLLAAMLEGWWTAAGLIGALMLATKETAALALAASAIAYGATHWPVRPTLRSTAGFLLGLVCGVSVLVAPPWKWGLVAEVTTAYFERGVGGGSHPHPWYTYLRLLSITEVPILIAGAIGAIAAWRSGKPALRFLSLYAAILLAIYSVLPYKTPWCSVSSLFAIALLAGIGASTASGKWRLLPFAAVACLGLSAWFANGPFASDPRNPWAYAQTGSGVYTIRDRLEQLESASAAQIDIYTTQNLWPLPWYLRRFPNVRWWTQVSIAGAAAPIVVVTPELEEGLVRKLYEGPSPGERELYMTLFDRYVELRPQVEIRGYVAKSLWDRLDTR